MSRFYALLCCLSIVGCVFAGNVANLRGSLGNASTAVNSAVSQISSETSSLTQAGVESAMGEQLSSSPLPVVPGLVLPPVVPGLTPEVRLPPVVVPAVVPSIVRNLPVPSLPLAPLMVPLTAPQANATTAQYGVAVDNKTDLATSRSRSDWAHAGEQWAHYGEHSGEQYADYGEHVGEQYAHVGEDYAHGLSSETKVSNVPVPVVRVPPLVAQLAASQSNASVQEDVPVHNATDLESSWWGSEWAHVGEQYAHYGEHMGQQYAHEGEGYGHFGEHIGEQYAHVGEDYARHYAR